MKGKIILTHGRIEEIIEELSQKVYGDFGDYENFAIIGIQSGGVYIANKVRNKIEKLSGKKIKSGELDITFHRDDLATRGKLPEIKETRIDFDISDMIILMVDDVLYTGRTTKAAIETLMTYGRPKIIKLFVLVDRGNRELPFQADYCGYTIETGYNERVEVNFSENDADENSVILYSESE